MRRAAWTSKVLGLLLLALASASSAQNPDDERAAAIVNDQVITVAEVRDRMRAILAQTAVRPGKEVLLQIREQALSELIAEHGGDPATTQILIERPDAESSTPR